MKTPQQQIELVEKVAEQIQQMTVHYVSLLAAQAIAKQILFNNNLGKITGDKLPSELTSRIPLLEEILDELGWKSVITLKEME